MPPDRTSEEKDGVRLSDQVELPLVAPLKLKVPRVSSAAPTKLLMVEKVIPVVVGAPGVPVPSVQLLFCIQERLNWPAPEALKMPLLGGMAVNWSVTD